MNLNRKALEAAINEAPPEWTTPDAVMAVVAAYLANDPDLYRRAGASACVECSCPHGFDYVRVGEDT